MGMREKLIEILSVPIYPHELVDPIEAVADYLIDSGVTIQQWIPVTELVPSFPERVLVYVKQDPYSTGMIDTDRRHNGKWVRWNGCVTHWMHLPEPPKGVE